MNILANIPKTAFISHFQICYDNYGRIPKKVSRGFDHSGDDDDSNSLTRQKEVAQGKEKGEAGDRRKGVKTGIRMPGADSPIGPSRSGVTTSPLQKSKYPQK